jgi:hypothetical protein
MILVLLWCVTKLLAKQLSVMDALVHYHNRNAFVVKIILVVKIAWLDHLAGILRIAGFFFPSLTYLA